MALAPQKIVRLDKNTMNIISARTDPAMLLIGYPAHSVEGS